MTDLGVTMEERIKDNPCCLGDASESEKNRVLYPRLWVSDVEISGLEIGQEVTLKAVCMGVTKREKSGEEEACYSYEFDVKGCDAGRKEAPEPMNRESTSDKMDEMFDNFDKKSSKPKTKKEKDYATPNEE